MNNRVEGYTAQRAQEYDQESEYDKGDRSKHLLLLDDILSYREGQAGKIIELGSGTGFFSSVLSRRYPQAGLWLIDGSEEMLGKARSAVTGRRDCRFIRAMLQEAGPELFEGADIVFSALTIHHLCDEDKGLLYDRIWKGLQPGGWFVYFDQFRLDTRSEDLLLEYLACKDIQRRLRGDIPEHFYIRELEIGEIIRKDRMVKENENDREAVYGETLARLRSSGFATVTTVYQEARFFAIAAIK